MDDISFITRCPSLKYLRILPLDTKEEGFDYSPLYAMPEIRYLDGCTLDDRKFKMTAPLDYAKIQGLQEIIIDDMGEPIYNRININQIKTLRKMTIRSFKSKYRNVTDLFISPVLEDLEILQSNICSMEGIDTSKNIKSLALYYNRSLADLSALGKVSESLTKLSIDACAKITDFSFLCHLPNLQFLDLRGSNVLKSLDFLHHMENLKTFILDMDVEDGDLTPCLSIPDVRSARNRRHFNLKNEELPKPPQT